MAHETRLIDQLSAFPALLAGRLAAVPADALDFVPSTWEGVPSERLTIRQQICHLRDIETDGYQTRFERVLRETHPFLPSIDSYGLISSRRYDETPIGAALDAFTVGRRQSLALLTGASPNDFRRRGDFEGYGQATLLGLAHFLASHDAQHIAGIEWLLGMHSSL